MPGKLQKFAEYKTFPRCFSYVYEDLPHFFPHRGQWNREVFLRQAPIILELGCGYGEYTVGMARLYPEKNYIGIDRKSNRMWTGARQVMQEGLSHVAFLRTSVEFLPQCFGEGEISEIWLTFPDPHEPRSGAKKRLTSPRFLKIYKQMLSSGGKIHLKTDNPVLFDYTLEVLKFYNIPVLFFSENIYSSANLNSGHQEWWVLATSIKTRYEKMFSEKGHTIRYLVFSLDGISFSDF